jgi:peroxiredoxin Q/BCP
LCRCTAEGDGFKSLLPKFEEKNVAIIGCSNDPVEKNAEFADKQGYTFPLICDTDLAVSVAYHAAPDPSAGKANRVAVLIDPSGNVEEYFGQVDPKEFPEQLLGKL